MFSYVFYLNFIIFLVGVLILVYLFIEFYVLLLELVGYLYFNLEGFRCLGWELVNGNGKYVEYILSFEFYCEFNFCC